MPSINSASWFHVAGAILIAFFCIGYGSVHLPFRTWVRTRARLTKVEVDDDCALVVHYEFTVRHVKAASETWTGSILQGESFWSVAKAEARAAQVLASGFIDIWYAYEEPTMQYLTRPGDAALQWKGLWMIAVGLFMVWTAAMLVRHFLVG